MTEALSYRNQFLVSMDWYLYDNGLRHERVNVIMLTLVDYDYKFLSADLVAKGNKRWSLFTEIHNLRKRSIIGLLLTFQKAFAITLASIIFLQYARNTF